MLINRLPRFGGPLSCWALSCWFISTTALADEVRRPVNERYAEAGADENPDFRQHVVPLLGRLGCNGRACHGSFQGRGGFRLSLFGHDFKMDQAALTEAGSGRVDVE